MTIAEMKYDVKDLNLADQGKNQIEWAFKDMPIGMRPRYKRNRSALRGHEIRRCRCYSCCFKPAFHAG